MRLSANLGLPIAEPDDARRDFPTVVDGPRTDQLDAAVAALQALMAQLGLAGKKIQAGSDQVVMSAGVGQIVYPVPFASPAYPVATVAETTGLAVSVRIVHPSTEAGFSIQLLNSSSQAIATGTFRINWVAVGAAAASKPAPDEPPANGPEALPS